ncbi:phage portal protein [Geomicrobium sediminis]|uniref:SPP1 family phage portal protein n=1 Tax=Geomicrobium sediminis TaxID=1347788 RepID=A0ABS2P6U6_9BACL|nr:SPP1 family phage portal protein [Geomicrobium sediminis]
MDEELIKKCLRAFRQQRIKYRKYQDYYDGRHDIVRNYAMADSRANMKVVVNFFKKFINDEVAYALGNPVSYVSRKDDHNTTDLVDLNFGHWSKQHDQNLIRQANIFGEAYELFYINEDSEFKATTLTPLNAFVLENGDAENTVRLALHVYKEHRFSDREMLDVYEGEKVHQFSIGNNDAHRLVHLDTKTTNFKQTPVVVCMANPARRSLLDDIKSAIDAYNNTLSDLVNEVSDFRQAFLKITGATLGDDEAKKMKRSGIINVPAKGEVDYLTKQINDTFVNNLLSNLEEKIYKLSSHIDTNEKLQSNLSGAALRSRMIALENRCVLMQSMLEKTVKRRLKAFFEYQQLRTGQVLDYRQIKLKFTMNVPQDILMLADALSKYNGIVSHRTMLSMLPFVENPDLELEQVRKERDDETQRFLDLDRVGMNPGTVTPGDDDG